VEKSRQRWREAASIVRRSRRHHRLASSPRRRCSCCPVIPFRVCGSRRTPP